MAVVYARSSLFPLSRGVLLRENKYFPSKLRAGSPDTFAIFRDIRQKVGAVGKDAGGGCLSDDEI